MKTLKKASTSILVGLTLFLFTAQAQDSSADYGEDSVACLSSLSTMSEFMKIDLYDMAIPAWREILANCPAASKNTYIYGVKIVKHMLENAKTEQREKELVDTLMLLYDYRIKYFNDRGDLLGRKGIDLIRYNRNAVEEAYGYLQESIELEGKNSSSAVLVTYMQLTSIMYKMGELQGQDVIDNYLLVTETIDQSLNGKQPTGNTLKALEGIENIFATSGAATCEALEEIFRPKFEENPDDVELLKKTLKLLENSGCDETALFTDASVKLFEIEPSATSAYYIAKQYLKKSNYEEASKYYLEATQMEEDPEKLADYYYELALVKSKLNDPVQARTFALKAIENRENWGAPYILIGNLYAAAAPTCGENDFEKNAVYWAVVDKYAKAKSVDPSVAAEAQDLISKYAQYYPNKENAFFYDYTEGKTYRIGCWINESTTVRF